MKANKVAKKRTPAARMALAAILVLAAAGIGVATAYSKLRELWVSQCVVTDVTEQATCTEGVMVKAETVLNAFGIRNGANLALIDFDARRREILESIPNIRSISVTRRLPRRVSIVVEERTPAVRMGVHGVKAATGRVADADGVVFTCRRNTNMLPLIRERPADAAQPGQRLTGRARAALELVEAAGDPEFVALGVLEVDVSKQDYLLATLGNYAQAKVAWNGMDNPTEANHTHLVARLRELCRAVRNPNNIGAESRIWNATIPGQVFADTKEPIQ